MTGTESQRRWSARQLAILLGLQSVFAIVAIYLVARVGLHDPVRPIGVMAFYAGLAIVAGVAAVLEWRRAAFAEFAAIAAGAGGFYLTIAAVMNGWWFFAPFLGVDTLGVFLALAYRYAVRDPNRRRDVRFHT